MSAASISFYASAGVALVAALAAVLVRRSDRSLACFAITFAALVVPLIELRASMVAGAMLLAATGSVALLGLVARLGPEGSAAPQRMPLAYWLPAGLGLLGLVWVVLATGSRQVVDLGAPLSPKASFGQGEALLLEFGGTFLVPALLVALLALAAVIAAALAVVTRQEGS
jgi:NADH:ubiquinone oxidoreductase subunit 6 (subunit J)